MLVTRQCETARHSWLSGDPESASRNETVSRVSNFEPIAIQSEWRGAYSHYHPSADIVQSSPHKQALSSNAIHAPTNSHLASTASSPGQHHFLQDGNKHESISALPTERPDSAPPTRRRPRSHRITSSANVSNADASRTSGSPFRVKAGSSSLPEENAMQTEVEGDEEGSAEDEVLDVDGQATKKRLARARAKNQPENGKKPRHRLNSQQTRFLTSEFSKQAHPDAAHRERLSREIPDYSPRQVQIWFQNRRAKNKRLPAKDRERMVRMRALPEGFDNIQALHSPYGAVNGMGGQVPLPAGYSNNLVNQRMGMNPLMVDTMQRGQVEHASPPSLSPDYGNGGITPSDSLNTPDALSTLPLAANGGYHSNHLNSPIDSGARSSNPYMNSRHNSFDGYGMKSSRSSSRSQPFHLQGPTPKSQSQPLQSPLPFDMAWKGDSNEYASYSPPSTTSSSENRRQPSLYLMKHRGGNAASRQQHDGDSCSPSDTHTPPTYAVHPTSYSATATARLRPASSACPTSLGLLNQYRDISAQNQLQGVTAAPRTISYGSAYSSDTFNSSPLIVSADYQMRTPIEAGPRSYQIPQMGAPIDPSHGFTNAYQQSLSPRTDTSAAPQQESISAEEADNGEFLQL